MIVAFDDRTNVNNINLKDCRFDGVHSKPVNIKGKTEGVNYDNLIINGSLILSQYPYKHYSEWMTYSEMKRTPLPYMLDFAKKPRWNYASGIELESMLDTYLAYGGDSIISYLKAYPAKMIAENGDITGYKYEDFNLDNTRPGRFILRMNQLFPEKNRTRLSRQYSSSSRNSRVRRTECGGTRPSTPTRYGSMECTWGIRSTQWRPRYSKERRKRRNIMTTLSSK